MKIALKLQIKFPNWLDWTEQCQWWKIKWMYKKFRFRMRHFQEIHKPKPKPMAAIRLAKSLNEQRTWSIRQMIVRIDLFIL